MSTLRVLIVDDERLFAELMRVALSNAPGIEVVGIVHDVDSAVASANELRPAVVLSDYHLPDGTGSDVARTLRRTAPEISVLILTGDPSMSVLADVARSGAVGHLTKARDLGEVVTAVRSAATGEILFAPSELQRLLVADRS
ncbi:MAG: response regulator transcription factor, partial [Chloroflexota bacterium]|nr:response regulator transcription factor [Chloroflexota bacterium]